MAIIPTIIGGMTPDVEAALALKANLTSANFGEIQLDGNQVASYTYGSNANGRWQKWFDKDGNVIRVEQYNPVDVSRANGTQITLPTAMPDANYNVHMVSVNISMWCNYYTRSTTTFYVSNQNPANYQTATSNWSVVWSKS